jgi:hypothetical protein
MLLLQPHWVGAALMFCRAATPNLHAASSML